METLLLSQEATAVKRVRVHEPTYRLVPGPHPDPFHVERMWALCLLVALAAYLRAWDPMYSTAYLDEAKCVLEGRMFFAWLFGFPVDLPLRAEGGWFLWSLMAAAADRIGGIVAVRELGAVLGMVTVVAMYNFARRLFTPEIGLASASIFTVLAPEIYTCRIATANVGAVAFFAIGLWAYVHAWQEKSRRAWVTSAVFLFASFLCKYLVAIYFPVLLLLPLLWKRRDALLPFVAPLAAASLGCAGYYWRDAVGLAALARSYAGAAAGANVWNIYFDNRLDFWLLAVLSFLVLLRRDKRNLALLLWGGALLLLLFQAAFHAHYDYWKNVRYALLLLTPMAAGGCIWFADRFSDKSVFRHTAIAALAIAVVCGMVAWTGHSWTVDRFLFWPNVEPALTYFDGRLTGHERVLVDDAVFRYYLNPTLPQSEIVDPYDFSFNGLRREAAYSEAVRLAAFDYVILDGGIGYESRQLQTTIRPWLAQNYDLRLSMPEPVLEHPIEIWARRSPPPPVPARTEPYVEIQAPVQNRMASSLTVLKGFARGATANWKVRGEVFTDRWYYQGQSPVGVGGDFELGITLLGGGSRQCYHLVRARLVNEYGQTQATSTVFGVARANADGTAPGCAAMTPPVAALPSQ